MFRLIEPSSGHHPCMCTHWMYLYCVLYLAWWLNEPKHVAEFLIFLILITNICCVYWLIKLLYYCKTQRDDCYQRFREQPCSVTRCTSRTLYCSRPQDDRVICNLVTSSLACYTGHAAAVNKSGSFRTTWTVTFTVTAPSSLLATYLLCLFRPHLQCAGHSRSVSVSGCMTVIFR